MSETAKSNEITTAAAAAKLVRREVPQTNRDGKVVRDGDGNVVTELVAVREAEVFAFRDHGDHVNVVTVDGRKLRGEKGKAA